MDQPDQQHDFVRTTEGEGGGAGAGAGGAGGAAAAAAAAAGAGGNPCMHTYTRTYKPDNVQS